MELKHRYSTKECANCNKEHIWSKATYIQQTELKNKADVCICPNCRKGFDFTSDPCYKVLGWVDKAVQGVDGYYLQTL